MIASSNRELLYFSPPEARRLLIKTILLQKGVSVTSLAERCGRSPSLVSAVISGKKRSAFVELYLCKILGLNRSELWH